MSLEEAENFSGPPPPPCFLMGLPLIFTELKGFHVTQLCKISLVDYVKGSVSFTWVDVCKPNFYIAVTKCVISWTNSRNVCWMH